MNYPPTTDYGTWCNHGDRNNTTVEATVADAINGGDRDWQHRMRITGAFDRLVDAYRNAINAALAPSGISLCGNDFLGPHQPFDIDTYEDDKGTLSDIIDEVCLNELIVEHDVDLHEIDPRVLLDGVMSRFDITWPVDDCCGSGECVHDDFHYEPQKLQVRCRTCDPNNTETPLIAIEHESDNPLRTALIAIEFHLTDNHPLGRAT